MVRGLVPLAAPQAGKPLILTLQAALEYAKGKRPAIPDCSNHVLALQAGYRAVRMLYADEKLHILSKEDRC